MEQYDNERIYCRKLGHWLTFHYCRLENNSLPCRTIADCWSEKMDIGGFLEENYTKEEIASVFISPKPKLASLVELIEQAKKRGTADH
ncbi:MAG: hypothetical protein JXA18_11505 [Chitinispirillaceae bacterium]|nr:hypothetical protein [Chitinispirillaceae bacterium]